MNLADGLVVVGFVVLLAGLYGTLGWAWTAIIGGVLVIGAAGRLQRAEKPR